MAALQEGKGCGVRVDTPRVLAPFHFAGVWASTPTDEGKGCGAIDGGGAGVVALQGFDDLTAALS